MDMINFSEQSEFEIQIFEGFYQCDDLICNKAKLCFLEYNSGLIRHTQQGEQTQIILEIELCNLVTILWK